MCFVNAVSTKILNCSDDGSSFLEGAYHDANCTDADSAPYRTNTSTCLTVGNNGVRWLCNLELRASEAAAAGGAWGSARAEAELGATVDADATAASIVTGVIVTVADQSEAHPQLTTDESYTLTISGEGVAAIDAQTIYGAMHGLETFSQLTIYDFDQMQHTLPLAPWTIKDTPRYAHRGLMIDTARHFQPIASIKRVIDSLPYAKVNVLHW